MEFELPLQDTCAACGSFRLRDVAGMLQGDRQRRVGQRVVGSEDGESHGRGDGLVELAGIAQSANQAVMGFNVGWVGGDGGAKRLRCLKGGSGGELVESALGERVGGGRIGHVWF